MAFTSALKLGLCSRPDMLLSTSWYDFHACCPFSFLLLFFPVLNRVCLSSSCFASSRAAVIFFCSSSASACPCCLCVFLFLFLCHMHSVSSQNSFCFTCFVSRTVLVVILFVGVVCCAPVLGTLAFNLSTLINAIILVFLSAVWPQNLYLYIG